MSGCYFTFHVAPFLIVIPFIIIVFLEIKRPFLSALCGSNILFSTYYPDVSVCSALAHLIYPPHKIAVSSSSSNGWLVWFLKFPWSPFQSSQPPGHLYICLVWHIARKDSMSLTVESTRSSKSIHLPLIHWCCFLLMLFLRMDLYIYCLHLETHHFGLLFLCLHTVGHLSHIFSL